jgi:hypothetical protein
VLSSVEPVAELRSAITLFLAGNPELEAAHWELYPERVDENIPLSLTLLYPFAPPDESGQHFGTLRDFFAARPPLEFSLVRLAEFPGTGIYGVPETDPPPHASLGRHAADPDPVTLMARADARVGPLLPAPFVVCEATLMEMHEPDRWHVRTTFPFGG